MSSQAIFWVVVGIIAIIALLTCTYIFNGGIDDLEDVLIVFIAGGWIPVLIILGIGAIIYGFLFWNWWAMLIIAVSAVAVPIIIWKLVHKHNGSTETEDGEVIKTKYKCANCGAYVSKIITEDNCGDEKILYKCEYCGISYNKKELLGMEIDNKDGKYNGIELTDFEEEYFCACERFFYKPFNRHSRKRIENKYEHLKNKLYDGEDIYSDIDCDDSEDVLDNAYEFLTENEQEIEEYFSKTGEEEIKRRYEYYRSVDSDDEE